VEEEGDDIRGEAGSAGLPLLREVRERERPDDHPDRDRVADRADPRRRWVERDREAEQQVREDEQDRDVEPLHRVLGESARVGRHRAPDERDEAERGEGEHCPEGGAVAAPEPEPDRDHPERHERHEVDVFEHAGEVAHRAPDEVNAPEL